MAYIVISPPSWIDCEELHKYLIHEHDQFATSRCVMEFGKDGTHPHLNYVCEDSLGYAEIMETLEAYIKTLYYPCGKRRKMGARVRAVILHKQTIRDQQKLDEYLSKEQDCKILLNNPYPEVEWEFTYLDYKDFKYEITTNAIHWLHNYNVVKQLRICEDPELFDKEVRLMLITQLPKLIKYNCMHYGTREGIRQTILTGLKR